MQMEINWKSWRKESLGAVVEVQLSSDPAELSVWSPDKEEWLSFWSESLCHVHQTNLIFGSFFFFQ